MGGMKDSRERERRALRASGPANDLAQRDDLAGVARGVLGRVIEQPDHGAGQLRAANLALLEQTLRIGRSQGLERGIERTLSACPEILQVCPELILLVGERVSLGIAQRFTTCIGEQPIEAAGNMTKVEADAGGVAGPGPYLLLIQLGGSLEVRLRVQQHVRCRHQLTTHTGHRPAQPRFWHITPGEPAIPRTPPPALALEAYRGGGPLFIWQRIVAS
jgi:hypothetical protein